MSSGPFRTGPCEADDLDSDRESSGGRYCLLIGPRQVQLHAAETFIGRDDSCEVAILGSLVSRRHARVLLDDGELSLEDLGSTNGTFLNGAKVQGLVPLRPGDRVFIGSFVIEVMWFEGDLPASGTFGDDAFDRATPSSGVAVVQRPAELAEPDHWEAVTQRGPGKRDVDLDEIESAGRLAERMFALGRPRVGREILSGPLSRILDVARSGRSLEQRVLDAAGRCAVKLAQEVFDAKWVNLALEIHLHAGHPMKRETLEQIVDLRKGAPIGDDDLVGRYLERLSAMIGFMPLPERLLYAQLAGYALASEDDP